VIVISHDRYFMDKVVDNLLVFQGNAQIKDFPGNYTDYRLWRDARQQEERKLAEEQRRKQIADNPTPKREQPTERKRLTFKERKELEELDALIPQLEAEKARLEEEMCSGTLATDQLIAHSRRIEELIAELDDKGMRWLELSEIEG
ncbi:MAG: ABC transporter ATP-binding protein, partial [Bacteroidales bacterium]|nr:ABC transporter ATP-binding protein [Bacteroidales bacterium]